MTERREAPKRLPGWVWGGLFGCVVILSWMGWNGSLADKKLKKLFGSAANLRCVQTAAKVYATRLGQVPGLPEVSSRIQDYIAIAEPVEATSELSERLKKLLTASDSYLWGIAKSCAPVYGYRLRFVCDGTPVEAWVCLKCSQIVIVVDGKSVGGGLFDPAARELKEISMELFPGDPAMAIDH